MGPRDQPNTASGRDARRECRPGRRPGRGRCGRPLEPASWPTPGTTSPTWPGSRCPWSPSAGPCAPGARSTPSATHRGHHPGRLANAPSSPRDRGHRRRRAWPALLHPQPVQGSVVVGVALGAFFVNALAALLLREGGRDLNMRGAAFHMSADAVASLVVAVAGAMNPHRPPPAAGRPIASLAVGPSSSSRPTGSCVRASTSCSSRPRPTSTWPP